MNSDINLWSKTCLECQRSKIDRHSVADLGKFPNADRFEHIHVDIIGPLPITEHGYRYCLTVIDRYTRWPEALPIRDITAETVAKFLYENWICRYGCPIKLTSDQGRQFESSLFRELMNLLGINRIRTTSYHPQANGAVERWHRTLKAALMARLSSKSWVQELPTVLLGLRAAYRSDSGVSAAQLTFGRTLRLPGDFYDSTKNTTSLEPSEYIKQIQSQVKSLQPVPESHSNTRSFFVHPDLSKVNFVFVRDDSVRKPLKPPYDGPYRVVERRSKVYIVQLPNRQTAISIDRLKPAYVLAENESKITESKDTPEPPVSPGIEPMTSVRRTRYGRVIKPTVRFNI
ncbi:unnamed protein product [Colias eurytheme]|nr:unnamed protein product [Colias eurytheme]